MGHNLQLQENLTFACPAPGWLVLSHTGLKLGGVLVLWEGHAQPPPARPEDPDRADRGLDPRRLGWDDHRGLDPRRGPPSRTPVADQYCCNRYCEDYVNSNGISVSDCNRSVLAPNSHPGSLWNGELVPLANMTIGGAIWLQGENNGLNPGNPSTAGPGYACLLPAMIAGWRREFSARSMGATAPDFPFGVINLHGWCGEEEGSCNPGYPNSFGPGKNNPSRIATSTVAAMRWSQLGGMPAAPNLTLGPNTFVAMTYDLADPQFGYSTTPCSNCSSVGKTACFAPQPQSNGPIRPRNKLEVGTRVALAALALADGAGNAWHHAGPAFEGCEAVVAASATAASATVGGGTSTIIATVNISFSFSGGSKMCVKNADGFELQLADRQWVPAPIMAASGASLTVRTVRASLPVGVALALLGLRLHWKDNPCCPRFYSDDPAYDQWWGGRGPPQPRRRDLPAQELLALQWTVHRSDGRCRRRPRF